MHRKKKILLSYIVQNLGLGKDRTGQAKLLVAEMIEERVLYARHPLLKELSNIQPAMVQSRLCSFKVRSLY